jgi:DNA polymerase-3 subunit delta'
MSIFDVCCQPKAQRLIQRALASARVPHAYIFHGPDGVGKEMFARRLAQLLMCAQPVSRRPPDVPEFAGWPTAVRDACGQCQQCKLVLADTHPDLHLIDRSLKDFHPDATIRDRVARNIGVEVIRQFLLNPVGTKPSVAQVKVFIVREADQITPQAQNAMLKTLEEPPPATFIILLASAIDRLLPTTRSRCQLVPFGALPTSFVATKLRELRPDVPTDRAELFARLSGGSLGAALLLAEHSLHEYNEELIRRLAEFVPGDAVVLAKWVTDESKKLGPAFLKRDDEITETEAQRRGAKALLALAATWYRDVALTASSAAELVTNRAPQAQVAVAAQRLTPRAAADAVKAIAAAERQLDLNINVQLCLEALFVKLSRL